MTTLQVDGMKQPTYDNGTAVVNGNVETMAEQAARLLDFNPKLDINLLDNVVNCMYTGEGAQLAKDVLTTLKENPDAWTRVDTILEFSKNQQTKYYGLQILENFIKTRWKVLPRNQCEGIKKYIVGLIIKTSSDAESLENEKVYLNKLNMILVQILKREWPKNWHSFISDIVGASKTNKSLCQDNMNILQLLSEEVFDFSSGQMTQAKAKHLKDSMCTEFSQIFQLCQFGMENSQNALLVHATLETLLRFLNSIPLGYIFETKLISTLIFKILPPRNFLKDAYTSGGDEEQKFIQNLSLFLCTFLKEHGNLIEKRSDLHDLALHLSTSSPNLMFPQTTNSIMPQRRQLYTHVLTKILSMVEEAAGTRMYEMKKENSLKIMMKKEDRLMEIDKETHALANKEKDILNQEKKIEKLKQVSEEDGAAAKAAEKYLHDMNAGMAQDADGKAATIASQLMAAEGDIKKAETEEKMASMNLTKMKEELAKKQAAYTEMDDVYKAGQTSYKALEKQIARLKQEIVSLGYDEQKAQKVRADKDRLYNEIHMLRDELDRMKSRHIHQIFVRGIYGNVLAFDVESDFQIIKLKDLIWEKTGIRPETQALIYQSKYLQDQRSISSYGLPSGCIVDLMLKLMGGVKFYIQKASGITEELELNSAKAEDIPSIIHQKTGIVPAHQKYIVQEYLHEPAIILPLDEINEEAEKLEKEEKKDAVKLKKAMEAAYRGQKSPENEHLTVIEMKDWLQDAKFPISLPRLKRIYNDIYVKNDQWWIPIEDVVEVLEKVSDEKSYDIEAMKKALSEVPPKAE